MADWLPTLPETETPIFERLIEALAADIASGVLPAGRRLPPQRELAHRLGLGVGTVTRAYSEAERRGLLTATVGRGSFVAEQAEAAPAGPVDLSRNVAPLSAAAGRLTEAFDRLRKRGGLNEALDYSPPAGLDAHRRVAAGWLARTAGAEVDWRRLIWTAGAHQALSLLLTLVTRPGEALLCEAATFHGVRSLADLLGRPLAGVEMDGEGMTPDGLDRAAAETGARAVYLLPTLQNPTARSMGSARRADIARVARARDLLLIEDDVYAPYGRADGATPPTLAALAPERTFYISSLSKTLAPGVRAGFLVPPPGDHFERLIRIVRALTYAPSSLAPLVACQWIEDGAADAMVAEAVAEVRRRNAAARAILGSRLEPAASSASLHLWLPMSELAAERAAGRALRRGVELTPPAAPIVDTDLTSGLRVCLGGPPDLATLERALRVVSFSLSDASDERTAAVI
ncbi:GntR family transcriptional regulator [Caulobacter sp. CCUG 60055]|nr:PLP-dependent aminotransferase family protein [Caulobacter sp. CCUG 60055]MBQ1543964.1 PLP-dependent aminotransferase family protein [Caulobacteraceae bacterium]MCI3180576.1 GntR family transcriptional regulator [Caulobacter sp. CCUG 60055]